ncbi:MAG TPA: ATP-binding cassette domain-containing protein, partial [Syntrophales bacterium]|nr:ATP-binding cassette domain-containing protein [Syntrophales bacterium]
MGFLEIHNLHVSVGGKEIIKGIDLILEAGRTAIIFGPNGSGKSTLLGTIAGLPGYEITQGSIFFKDKDLSKLSIDERSRLGIGMS